MTSSYMQSNFSNDIIFVVLSGGGAGVGRPEERDPEAVRMDVKNELVSLEMAKNKYKIVLKPDTLEIDYEAPER